MENNFNKKKNDGVFNPTNIILVCILLVVLATAVFVVRMELGRNKTVSDSSEIASISIEDSENSESEEEAEEVDESSEKEESEEDSDSAEGSDVSEEDDDDDESISLEEFTKHNASLPFSKDDDDDLIIAFDTDDTLLVPDSDEEIDGAIKALNHLEDDGYDWCIISANADDDKPQRLQDWILDELISTDHYLGFYIVNPGRDRYNWCNENNVDVLVDDNKDTASLADDYLFHTLLVDGKGVEETTYLHPMHGSSPYNGFKSYLRSIKLLKSLD